MLNLAASGNAASSRFADPGQTTTASPAAIGVSCTTTSRVAYRSRWLTGEDQRRLSSIPAASASGCAAQSASRSVSMNSASTKVGPCGVVTFAPSSKL